MSGREIPTSPSPTSSSVSAAIARGAARPKPSILNGMVGSVEDMNSDYLCPICFNLIEEAYVTRCGHTFCSTCISKSIDTLRRCPKCGYGLPNHEHIFPNFLLNELIEKYKLKSAGLESIGACSMAGDSVQSSSAEGLRTFIAAKSQNLTMPDVDVMLEILTQRKQLLEAESVAAQNSLLYDFLKHLYQMKEEQRQMLLKEVSLIKKDMDTVEKILADVQNRCPTVEEIVKTDGSEAMKQELVDLRGAIDSSMVPQSSEITKLKRPANFSETSASQSTLSARRRRMHEHFDDFVKYYFSCRLKDLHFGPDSQSQDSTDSGSAVDCEKSGLDTFRENLVKFSRFKGLRPLATLSYSSDVINYSTIVSTIEFDKDNEFFAIAGVTKRIKVFDYNSVIGDMVDIHYPCVEMSSTYKISCVSWNTYHKGVMATSDYEGTVAIWDVTTGQRTKTYQEHDKRCWSVHFNSVDVRLIASGSDDARVKLWSLNGEHSIATLEAKFNVCCVRFNPKSSCHLAFGSADHCVHYYDLRKMKEPLLVFKDHRKAVSYVKFLNSVEIVSASTDSQLKMWNIGSPRCLRSFVGHINEKNFVGLATDGDYVACGSENNALYVYYKGLTKHLFSYKFEAVRSFLDQDKKDDEQSDFVSAVCWRQNSNVLVAANSQGTIKVLELI